MMVKEIKEIRNMVDIINYFVLVNSDKRNKSTFKNNNWYISRSTVNRTKLLEVNRVEFKVNNFQQN